MPSKTKEVRPTKTVQRMAARLGQPAAGVEVPGLQDFISEVVYAGIWDRPHLPCRTARVHAGRARRAPAHDSVEAMVAPALDQGLTPRNILEVFVQAGLYAALSRSMRRPALRERGVRGTSRLTVPPEPPRTDSNEALDARGRR